MGGLRARLGSLFVLPAIVLVYGTHWQLGLLLDHSGLIPTAWGAFFVLERLAQRETPLGRAAHSLRSFWIRWDPVIASIAIYGVLFRTPATLIAPLCILIAIVLVLALLRRANGPVLAALATVCLVFFVVLPQVFEEVLISRIAATYELNVDHRLRPDGEEINSDSARFRGEAEELSDDDFVILFLGDSFTFGFSLRYDDAYPYRFEALARGLDCAAPIRSVNMGWTSASPLLGLRLLRQVGAKYRPDLVVYNLDMTDFHDDLRYEHRLREQDDFEFDTSAMAERLIATQMPWASFATPWLRTVTDRLRWVDRGRREALLETLAVPGKEERYFIVRRPLEESIPAIEVGVMQNLDDMYWFSRDVLEAEMALVVYPRAFQYSRRESPRSWERGYEVLGPYVKEPFRYFEEVGDALPYPVFSLLADFEASEEFPLYFGNDPHWTQRGADFAARAVLAKLRAAGLVHCEAQP